MKKIVFIFFQPPTLSHEKNYYFQDLIRNKINIEVWDITYILFGDLKLTDEIERDYIKKIDSVKDFKKCFFKENLEEIIFVACVTFSFKSLWLYRILTKHKCTICCFDRGNLPGAIENNYRKIFRVVKKHDFKRIYEFITNRIAQFYRKIKLVKDYDFVFAAGNKAEELHKRASKVVSINSFDYDNYTQTLKNPLQLIDKRYCVFIDDMLPSHPDFSILGIKTLDPSLYYRKINKFFQNVENKFQLEVVIAAHPKASYTNNPFGERPHYKYKTCELIKNCEFVIAHASTSINFAVLFKKPIILIYDNEIKDIHSDNIYLAILSFANALGCVLCNIDDFHQIQRISLPEIDTKKYEEYKYQYLTSKVSEGRLSKNIFLDYVLQLIKTQP